MNPEKLSLALLLPLQIVMNSVAMLPFALAWYVGFTDWTPTTVSNFWEANFVGPSNFITYLSDAFFGEAVLRTLFIVAVVVPVEFALGFMLAYVFSGEFRGKKIATTIVLVPMMVVPAVGGYMFYLIFLESGPVNGFLKFVLGEQAGMAFLNYPATALMAVMLADIWQWTPFIFLIMVSSFLSLPQDPINAAYVLGASRGYTFRHVVLPMLKRPMIIALILRGIEALKIFDGVYIMTRGGPGTSTQTISMYLYEWGFKYFRYGYVTSESLTILIVLAIAGWYLVKPLRGE